MENKYQALKQALIAAGFEIYRMQNGELHLAERVRFHLMDAGVRVGIVSDQVHDEYVVRFVVKAQQSDFPSRRAEELTKHLRDSLRPHSLANGYRELHEQSVEVRSPSDANVVLDLWHEMSFEKKVSSVPEVIEQVRWALQLPKTLIS